MGSTPGCSEMTEIVVSTFTRQFIMVKVKAVTALGGFDLYICVNLNMAIVTLVPYLSVVVVTHININKTAIKRHKTSVYCME